MNPPAGSIRHYAPFIGLRYSFSRKRNRFTSVIAMVSMLGMVIGVASLITVLSVMNGFGGELRQRILSLVPHGYVAHGDAGISGWRELAETLQQSPGVVAVSPYISAKVLLASPTNLRGAVLTAIDPALEKNVSRIPATMIAGSLESLGEDGFNVVLGASLARVLRVAPGDFRRRDGAAVDLYADGRVPSQQTAAGERPVRGGRPAGRLPGLRLPGHRAEAAGPARACRRPAGKDHGPVYGARHHGGAWRPDCPQTIR